MKESNRKPNKQWVDKDRGFYNRSMELFFQNSNIETYSMHNEGKPVVAERFIRSSKNESYKYMTSMSKMCIFIN